MRELARLIPHAARCPRPAPLLRLSWDRHPQLFCTACGRACPAPDTRPNAPEPKEPTC